MSEAIRGWDGADGNSSDWLGDPRPSIPLYHRTRWGGLYHGDSLDLMQHRLPEASVDLVVTSPPFALVRPKAYGNVEAQVYAGWFRPFGEALHRVLKPHGSLVLDIGGSWIPGQPTRSLYPYELLLMLCKEIGFHLAQEYFWWNPARLPTPAEWVTVRRIRVKDAVNHVFWLSPSPWPRADNRRVLQPYSESMERLLEKGSRVGRRPSGHIVGETFKANNGAAIPPNLLALSHTESNTAYLRYCRVRGVPPHPARFPAALPEYFLRMLTDPGDSVLDPFAGSCTTGEVAERLERRWLCAELMEEYLKGARGRFQDEPNEAVVTGRAEERRGRQIGPFYRVFRPDAGWRDDTPAPLSPDGGRTRLRDEKNVVAKKVDPRVGAPDPLAPQSLPSASAEVTPTGTRERRRDFRDARPPDESRRPAIEHPQQVPVPPTQNGHHGVRAAEPCNGVPAS